MPEPTVHPHTRRVYDELPEVYRDADRAEPSGGGWPLLRFLSLIGDQIGAVEDLIDRIDPDIGGGSDLVDPNTADPAWLPWLGQLVGVVDLPPDLTEVEQRNAVAGAVGGWRAGARQGLATAARTALEGGSGYVDVRPHHGGDPFTIGISVDPEGAPANLDDVITAIEAARARPAGIDLVIDLYAATWDTIEARYPTWAQLDAVASWSRLEATLPPA